MPITRMLLRELTPSILESSWLTTVSPTPVPSRDEPRALHTESISSKMMMCSSESSPRSAYSASASAKRLRMFSSLCPTNLERTSGPLTIFGSFPLSILPICRAMSVLPVPGGPYSSMPLTWFTPSFLTTDCGNMREANARRKMSENSLSRPPMPMSANEKSCLKIVLRPCDSSPVSTIGDPCILASSSCV